MVSLNHNTFLHLFNVAHLNYNLNDEFHSEVELHAKYYFNYILQNFDLENYSQSCDIHKDLIYNYTYYGCYVLSHKYHLDNMVSNDQFSILIKCDLQKLNKIESLIWKDLNYEMQLSKYKFDCDVYIYDYWLIIEDYKQEVFDVAIDVFSDSDIEDNCCGEFTESDEEYYYNYEEMPGCLAYYNEQNDLMDSNLRHVIIDIGNLVN